MKGMDGPIVILHGWGKGEESFGNLKERLEQKGHTVYVFDLPGFGKEKEPPVPWSVGDYANLVLRTVQSYGLDKFFLVGHSFGGRVAIKFAAKYPEKLRSLILCDAAGITPRPQLRLAFFELAAKIGGALFSFPLLRPFYPSIRKLIYFLIGARDYYYLQTEVMRETFKKIIAEDLAPDLSKIKIPTLIIWGRRDKVIPIADAYIMHKGIAGSVLETLENVGHSPHLESPSKLGEIIDKFIARL